MPLLRVVFIAVSMLSSAGCGDSSGVDVDAGLDLGDGIPGDAAPVYDSATGPCTGTAPKSHPYQPGSVYWGRSDYIQYIAGNLPIVITVPHGGHLKPAELPDRSYGVQTPDTASQEYTLETVHYLKKATGRSPHLIINRLHRVKLDANREIVEAAQGNQWAEKAWTEYHAFTDAAKTWVTARCGRGLYLDFHTNGHADKWTEVGFMLSAQDLAHSDKVLDSMTYVQKSTIRALASSPGIRLSEVVRGPKSLGSLLGAAGFKAVPSQTFPHPAGGGYFHGGYSNYRHGSATGGVVDGIVLETYFEFVNTAAVRDNYSSRLSKALRSFFETYYTMDLLDPSWSPPVNGTCAKAQALAFGVTGKVTIEGTTLGAENEFGAQVTCGNTFALDGPQAYYSVELKAKTAYKISVSPSFPARVYLFGDTCAPKLISKQCQASGIGGALINPNGSKTFTITAGRTGKHTIAVDARGRSWYGDFDLTVETP